MGTTLIYNWLRTETGDRGEHKFEPIQFDGDAKIRCQDGRLTMLDMLEVINKWNRQSCGNWVYWL